MASSYHNILSKNDRALAAFVVAQGAGTASDVFPAKRSQGKSLPCTVCYSEKGTEEPAYSGQFTCASAVSVKTDASIQPGVDDNAARLASEQRVQKTFDAFHVDPETGSGETLARDITAAARALAAADPTNNGDLADYTAINVRAVEVEAGFNEEGTAWVDALNLEVVCVPSDVSPEDD